MFYNAKWKIGIQDYLLGNGPFNQHN